MIPFIIKILKEGNANKVLSSKQLARVIGGTEDNRYRQINKALEYGELLKVRRNLYVLSDWLRNYPVNRFALAQQLKLGSYISAETALRYHGWIPEAVHTILSVIYRGNSSIQTYADFGCFEFALMKVREGYFLHSVRRYQEQQQVSFIAHPMRALMDLMVLQKQEWQGLDFLLDGMRIDEASLLNVSPNHLRSLLDVYKGKRERHFITSLLQALGFN